MGPEDDVFSESDEVRLHLERIFGQHWAEDLTDYITTGVNLEYVESARLLGLGRKESPNGNTVGLWLAKDTNRFFVPLALIKAIE